MKHVMLLAVSACIFYSCKKNDLPQYNSTERGKLSVEFDNIAGSSDLQLNTATYTNASGEELRVTKVKYFVSNFILTTTDGTQYVVPQDSCYFLVDESDPTTHEALLKVPEGEYKTLRFTLGVDSLRNTMDITRRTGVLDPTLAASDMYWSWNSGYIFYKLEGISPAATTADKAFMYHIGGFGGYNTSTVNNLKNITIDLSIRGTPKIKSNKSANIHLFVDVLKALDGATNMSFANTSMIHSIGAGVAVANNYSNMITHDHTEN